MRDEILSYMDMCQRERMSLQKGMNHREGAVSVVLMSRRPSAPYVDRLSKDGLELVYEGHDAQRTAGIDPKALDQPLSSASGRLTENGKFVRAIEQSTPANRPLVRVYEKLRDGIWSDRGLFHLVSHAYVRSGERRVFRFTMLLSDLPDTPQESFTEHVGEHQRVIPSWVKQAVYKRDNGQCVICGANDQLHFDHEYPYSRGGASPTPKNVRILCLRHNLMKGARIE